MDNSNSLSNSLFKSSDNSFQPASTSIGSEGSSFVETLKNVNFTTWVIIFFVLAFLGFNIFVYLAEGTQEITNFFGPILKKVFGGAIILTGDTVDISAEGAKAVVTGTADILNSGLTKIQEITPNNLHGIISGEPAKTTTPQQTTSQSSTLNKALDTSTQSQPQNQNQNGEYQALESSSTVHSSSSKSGKAGWCYVGEDKGYRTCAQVGVNDTCMSGDIFPSQEICINPNLRA